MKKIKLICIKTTDGVKCNDNFNYNATIKKGEIFIVNDISYDPVDEIYISSCDVAGFYHKKDFITLEEFREQQLNKILNE